MVKWADVLVTSKGRHLGEWGPTTVLWRRTRAGHPAYFRFSTATGATRTTRRRSSTPARRSQATPT